MPAGSLIRLQFERDLIRERTRAGLAAATARGRPGGRKRVITPEKLQRARAMVTKGLTVRRSPKALSNWGATS